MRKEASLPIRLEKETRDRLDAAAKRLGLTVSALIRALVQSFLDEFEAGGGHIIMPPRWQKPDPQDALSVKLPAQGETPKPRKAAESRAPYDPTGR